MGPGKTLLFVGGVLAALIIAGLLLANVMGSEGRCPRRVLDFEAGEPLPELSVVGTNAVPESLRETIDGQFAVIDIWATWCKPCIRALPHLQALHNRFNDRGAMVVGVLVDRNAISEGPEFLDGRGVNYPMFFDDYGEEMNCAWGSPMSIPTMLLVDPEGHVVQVFKGTIGVKQIEKRLEVLLREYEAVEETTSTEPTEVPASEGRAEEAA